LGEAIELAEGFVDGGGVEVGDQSAGKVFWQTLFILVEEVEVVLECNLGWDLGWVVETSSDAVFFLLG
jgi:hypothetical protein